MNENWARGLTPLFVILLTSGLVVSTPSRGNPWLWDDLHLIRDYSRAELTDTWMGNYDPDGIETYGYRPLMTFSNHARYHAFGESPDANRVLSVILIACALTLFGAGLRPYGVPLYLSGSAGVVELTSKNFAYTYAWVTEGYHALQMTLFGLTLLGLSAAIVERRHRKLALALSVVFWALTLLTKDQGIVLLPILVGLSLAIAPTMDDRRRSQPVETTGSSALVRSVRERAQASWASRDIRRYVSAVVIVGIADMLALTVFVPGAIPQDYSVCSLLTQIGHVVSLGGSPSLPAYGTVSVALFILVLFTRTLGSSVDSGKLQRARVIALFSLLGMLSSTAFALVRCRSDLVYFPLLCYALFMCSSLEVGLRTIWQRRLLRLTVLATVGVLATISVVYSLKASHALQQAMGRWSIQTLALNYALLYGDESRHASIPEVRRMQLSADLHRVGIDGRLRVNEPLTFLYCEALANQGFLGVIPPLFAWGDDIGRPRPGDCGAQQLTRQTSRPMR